MNMDEFQGFNDPEENWSKLPTQLIEVLSKFTSQGELMVVLYILRHTWGFQEFDRFKKITLNEFMHGRKAKDLKKYPTGRMDKGVGMSKGAIIRGLQRAEEHGFIKVEKDERDKARVKKYYMLKMAGDDIPYVVSQNGTPKSSSTVPKEDPDVPKQDSDGSKVEHRSEKETLERNNKKEIIPPINDEIPDSEFDEDGAPIETPKPKKRYVSDCEYEHEDGTIEVIEDDSWKQPQKQIDYQALGTCGRESFHTEKEYNKLRKIEAMLESGKLSEEFWRNRLGAAEKHGWPFPELLRCTLSVDLQRKWKRQQGGSNER